MNIPKFKLRFRTSQTTDITPSIVFDRIVANMEANKYQIQLQTDKAVKFGRNPFQLVWNFQAPSKLDGGIFEINQSEQKVIVVLHYFINTLYPLAMIIALILFFTIQGDYLAVGVFGVFFILTGMYQYFTTRNVGRQLLADILD